MNRRFWARGRVSESQSLSMKIGILSIRFLLCVFNSQKLLKQLLSINGQSLIHMNRILAGIREVWIVVGLCWFNLSSRLTTLS